MNKKIKSKSKKRKGCSNWSKLDLSRLRNIEEVAFKRLRLFPWVDQISWRPWYKSRLFSRENNFLIARNVKVPQTNLKFYSQTHIFRLDSTTYVLSLVFLSNASQFYFSFSLQDVFEVMNTQEWNIGNISIFDTTNLKFHSQTHIFRLDSSCHLSVLFCTINYIFCPSF